MMLLSEPNFPRDNTEKINGMWKLPESTRNGKRISLEHSDLDQHVHFTTMLFMRNDFGKVARLFECPRMKVKPSFQ